MLATGQGSPSHYTEAVLEGLFHVPLSTGERLLLAYSIRALLI